MFKCDLILFEKLLAIVAIISLVIFTENFLKNENCKYNPVVFNFKLIKY